MVVELWAFFASTFEVRGSSPECIDCLHFLKWRAFLHSGSVHGVFPVGLHLEPAIGLTSSVYGLSIWSIHLSQAIHQLVLTMIELGSNATRCNPASVRTLNIAT